MPARRGQRLPCADRWQVLTECQQYRPGAPAERVSGQGGQSGTLHPAGQSSGKGAAGSAEPLAATAAALFGLSPDS